MTVVEVLVRVVAVVVELIVGDGSVSVVVLLVAVVKVVVLIVTVEVVAEVVASIQVPHIMLQW